MASNVPPGPQDNRKSVKAPLIFSAVLGGVAGTATMIFATGGATRALRWDLGLTAGIIAFVASLVISAMLLMTEKPNPDHLGKGSGVNLSSSTIPGGAGSVGRRINSEPAPGNGQNSLGDAAPKDPAA